MLKGIDVSKWQPNVNWTEVKAAGYDFCFIKATQSTDIVNPYFKRDWEMSKAAGLIRGAYHFFDPSADPVSQAEHFLNTVGELQSGDLFPVLDWETHGDNEETNALAFLTKLQSMTNKPTIIYSYCSYINEIGNPNWLSIHPLWLADLRAAPRIPKPWATFDFLQHSDDAKVPGVSSPCDENLFFGNLENLKAFQV